MGSAGVIAAVLSYGARIFAIRPVLPVVLVAGLVLAFLAWRIRILSKRSHVIPNFQFSFILFFKGTCVPASIT